MTRGNLQAQHREPIPEQPSAIREAPADRRAALAILLLAAAPLYLLGLDAAGFQDPDEGM
jgi:hypothetical protein